MLIDLKIPSEEVFKERYENLKKSWEDCPWSLEQYTFVCGGHQENHLETGIYESLSPGNGLFGLEDQYDRYSELTCMDKYDSDKHGYGVADNIEQIKDYLKEAIDDLSEKYIIIVSRIYQENEPEEEGWRWHRWGPYIGTLTPECEYLVDEDFGPDWQGYVLTFSIYKAK